MRPWKTIARRTILKRRKWLTVESHTVQLPDGRVLKAWPWIITPDFVNVVAVTTEGYFVCIRQFKYGVDGISLAPVGGYIEVGEEPLEAAKRELLEETGYEAPQWISLGSYRVNAARGMGTAFPFLARGAQRIAEPSSDDLEEQEVVLLTLSQARIALLEAEFKALNWVAAMLLALFHLDSI